MWVSFILVCWVGFFSFFFFPVDSYTGGVSPVYWAGGGDEGWGRGPLKLPILVSFLSAVQKMAQPPVDGGLESLEYGSWIFRSVTSPSPLRVSSCLL